MRKYNLKKNDFEAVYQLLLKNQAELTNRLNDLFRAFAFTNRYTLHPRRMKELPSEESENFLTYLAAEDADKVKELGQERLREGLGEQTILAVASLLRQFCWDQLGSGDLEVARAGLEATDRYISSYLEGYMGERESLILNHQEQIRRALSAALERQRHELHIKDHAMNTSINGIMLTNLEGRVDYVNPAFLTMWGYESPEEVLGENSIELLKGEESQETIRTLVERRGGGWRGELTARRKDGSTFEVEVSASLIRDTTGRPMGIMVSLIDITERKRAEESIRRLNEELEQRVIERTAELRESLEILQKTQAMLVQSEKMSALGGLVAGVAHEINSPVGIAVTAASFLDEKTGELAELFSSGHLKRSDLEKYVKACIDSSHMILSNLRRAAELVQSFMQVAVDQSSEERRKFKIKEYIQDVLLSLRPKLKKTQHTVTVHCPEDLELNSYPGSFSQIVTNLVMNSLIHGFEDIDQGEIVFEVSKDEEAIQFKYSDNGKGIKEAHLTKIFDPFFTTRRSHGGSGLGLHIVYNLVTQSLGGQIECHSKPGQGATFVIRIPRQ